jgi:hypothetical protein
VLIIGAIKPIFKATSQEIWSREQVGMMIPVPVGRGSASAGSLTGLYQMADALNLQNLFLPEVTAKNAFNPLQTSASSY